MYSSLALESTGSTPLLDVVSPTKLFRVAAILGELNYWTRIHLGCTLRMGELNGESQLDATKSGWKEEFMSCLQITTNNQNIAIKMANASAKQWSLKSSPKFCSSIAQRQEAQGESSGKNSHCYYWYRSASCWMVGRWEAD